MCAKVKAKKLTEATVACLYYIRLHSTSLSVFGNMTDVFDEHEVLGEEAAASANAEARSFRVAAASLVCHHKVPCLSASA